MGPIISLDTMPTRLSDRQGIQPDDFLFENQLSNQEEETGFKTGLGDYIRANAPYAMDMKPARYEDYYKAPWATSREFEERHRRICAEVGASLKGALFT